MAESRKELRQRLQLAGVWNQFVTLRAQLAADGMTPAQAKAEALARVEARTIAPPKSDAPDNASIEAPHEPANEQALPDFTQRVPNYEAAQWVAENLANSKVRPEDAPSGLAWGLLAWVRLSPANQSAFWGSIWAKLLPTGAALKSQQDKAADGMPHDGGTERALALCREWLKENGVKKA